MNSQYNTQNLFAQTTELAGNNALREANSLAVKADYMNQKNHIFSQTSFNPGVQRRLDSQAFESSATGQNSLHDRLE